MTFIHGPVCKGQVALNCINDHFGIMLLDPSKDRAEDNFWENYDWFQKKFNEIHNDRGGLVDLNRYYHGASK